MPSPYRTSQTSDFSNIGAAVWTGQQFHDFILESVTNLGPTFASTGLKTKIMLPEQGQFIFDLADATLSDSSAAAYVSIIAGHGYSWAGGRDRSRRIRGE